MQYAYTASFSWFIYYFVNSDLNGDLEDTVFLIYLTADRSIEFVDKIIILQVPPELTPFVAASHACFFSIIIDKIRFY